MVLHEWLVIIYLFFTLSETKLSFYFLANEVPVKLILKNVQVFGTCGIIICGPAGTLISKTFPLQWIFE